MKLRLAWQKHPLLVWAPLAKWHVARRKLGCQRVARRRKQHCATLGSPKTWSKMVKPTQPQSCMAGVHRWCVRIPSKKLPRYAGRESGYRCLSVHCSKHNLPENKHIQVYPSCSHMPALHFPWPWASFNPLETSFKPFLSSKTLPNWLQIFLQSSVAAPRSKCSKDGAVAVVTINSGTSGAPFRCSHEVTTCKWFKIKKLEQHGATVNHTRLVGAKMLAKSRNNLSI